MARPVFTLPRIAPSTTAGSANLRAQPKESSHMENGFVQVVAPMLLAIRHIS